MGKTCHLHCLALKLHYFIIPGKWGSGDKSNFFLLMCLEEPNLMNLIGVCGMLIEGCSQKELFMCSTAPNRCQADQDNHSDEYWAPAS